jgi:hypothetical protein
MPRKTLKDDEGNEYDVELPDDDDDDDAIYLDAEDVEWLKRKRLEESETQRKTSSQTGTSRQTSKVVRIRAKQDGDSGGSPQRASASSKSRKRVLKLA